jgi:hypothetical protein
MTLDSMRSQNQQAIYLLRGRKLHWILSSDERALPPQRVVLRKVFGVYFENLTIYPFFRDEDACYSPAAGLNQFDMTTQFSGTDDVHLTVDVTSRGAWRNKSAGDWTYVVERLLTAKLQPQKSQGLDAHQWALATKLG